MKKLLLLLSVSLTSLSLATAQCNEYYQISEGSEWEFQNYNGKEKLTGKNHQKVSSFEKQGNGYKAVVNSAMYDEKGKEITKGDLELSCKDGVMFIDMRRFITDDQLKAYESFELKVEADNLEIPAKLSVGQTLNEGSITITATNAPFPLNTTVTISDRKVEAKETITTPAGTFECFKISSKMHIKSMISMNLSVVEWIAPKAGLVRNESYNKSGKLMGYSILSQRKY